MSRVELLTSEDEIESIGSGWDALSPGQNAGRERFLTVARTHPAVVAPQVFALRRDARIDALLAARLEDIDFESRIARRTVTSTSVRSITVVHGGALGGGPGSTWEPLVAAVFDRLRSGAADVAFLPRVRVDSPLMDAVRSVVPRLWRNESEMTAKHWTLALPATYDELLRRVDAHRRKEFGRYGRVLAREFPGRVVVRRTTRPDEVPDLCRRVEVLARATYQRGLGTGFRHDEITQRCLVRAADRGALRALELEVDGRLRSFWIGEICRGSLCLNFTGFDRSFARFEPGTVLLLDVLKDAIRERVELVDYGGDDIPYKRRFGATSFDERDAWLFRPGLRGARLNATRAAVLWTGRAARSVVETAGLSRRWNDAMRGWARRRAASATVQRPASAPAAVAASTGAAS